MSHPINDLIDSVHKCTLCKAPMGTCDCWLTMVCTDCGRRQLTERDDEMRELIGSDETLECLCPDCNWKDIAKKRLRTRE